MSDSTVNTTNTAKSHRGRTKSPRTIAVQTLLASKNGDITYLDAQPILKAQGIDMGANQFNVIKSGWKRAGSPKKTKKVKPAAADPTETEAIAFVAEYGTLSKAKADVSRRIALIRVFSQLAKKTEKMAA